MRLTVSLDGGETWQEAKEGVRVSLDQTDEGEEFYDILLNCTTEGVIMDRYNHSGTCDGTLSYTLDDLASLPQ